MKEKWQELQEVLGEMATIKKREYVLTLAVCVLSGLVIGMLISPKKRVMIGSNNGNYNGNGTTGNQPQDDENDHDGSCCQEEEE